MSAADDDIRRTRAYDDVAETYQRVNVPAMFAEPGRVLTARVNPARGACVLDAGAGTGAVARALVDAVGPTGTVVLADASAAMLEAAGRTGLRHCGVGVMPHLPVRSGRFDAVTSAFAMTHLDDPDAAARDFLRILRADGTVGISAWYSAEDEPSREWVRIASSHVDADALAAASGATLPADARFARDESLVALLRDAGFSDIKNTIHHIDCSMDIDDFVAARSVCATGRALRALLPPDAFERVRRETSESLRKKFASPLRFQRRFHVATARRPR
jgi:ubiquinone/menaquinone biosynthesis C-methylase UbiE